MSNSLLNKIIFGGSVKRLVAHSQKKYEEGNVMYYFALITGVDILKVALTPGEKHDYRLVIDAIHNYQAKYPQKNVKEGYTAAISKIISAIIAKKAINFVFDIFDYEFAKLQNGTSRMRIDFDSLIKQLKDKVNTDYDKIREKGEGFDEWFIQKMDTLQHRVILSF